jgi:hypothetical protein
MTPPLSPERLTRLLDDAVRPVTAQPGALDRIREGTRRRRTARRAGVVLLTAAVIAGGTATALVLAPGGGPARIASLTPAPARSYANSQAEASPPPAGPTRTAAGPTAALSTAPSAALSTIPSAAPSAASSALPSAAHSAPPSAAQSAPPSRAQSAPPSAGHFAPPSAGQSAPPSAGHSAPPSAAVSAAPSGAQSTAPSAAQSTAPSVGHPTPAPAASSTPPSANRPAAAGLPPTASSVAWAIDGPGQPAASVSIVPVGNARTTARFLLVVRTAAHGTQTVPFSATSATGMPPLGPVVVGAANAAKDGHTELFVLVDAGCCTEFWTIFRLVDGHVAQVKLVGAPVRLAVGGSVTDNGGFGCAGPDLVTYTYQLTSATRETFLATRDTYRWVGASLLLVSQRQGTIRGVRNPELAQYSGVSCGALPQYVLNR